MYKLRRPSLGILFFECDDLQICRCQMRANGANTTKDLHSEHAVTYRLLGSYSSFGRVNYPQLLYNIISCTRMIIVRAVFVQWFSSDHPRDAIGFRARFSRKFDRYVYIKRRPAFRDINPDDRTPMYNVFSVYILYPAQIDSLCLIICAVFSFFIFICFIYIFSTYCNGNTPAYNAI